MRVTVTGAAGFIGSNLVDALLAAGHSVVGIDNFSTGMSRHLEDARRHASFSEARLDLLDPGAPLDEALAGTDVVVHLAANADVRFGWDAPRRDLDQNVVVTLNLLEAVRQAGVPRVLFSSTGSVYGESAVVPTPEDAPFPVQTSLYGASKLAAEGFIAAYAEVGAITATVFRFVSVLGPRYSHGHVIDFVRQLRKDPTTLRVLGDGTQRKSYMHVSDCVAGVVAQLMPTDRFDVLNLGVDDYCTVTESAGWIADRMGLAPRLEFTGGDRGWVGDNPFIYLDAGKARAAGWAPRYGIRESVEATVDYLFDEPWILEATKS